MRSGVLVGLVWLSVGLAILALVIFIPAQPGRISGKFYLVGSAFTALAWGVARLRRRMENKDRNGPSDNVPNQSTDPTLSSGTPAAGQPARHP
jgi:hypothetical protein